MKKTLIIVAHPDMEASTVHKYWVTELEKYPNRYTIHRLYQAYPEGKIDVQKEQNLVEAHGNLVLQFPVYWFNCPPLLKQWLDEVFTYGWGYGSQAQALVNRKIALAVSTGIDKEGYSHSGKQKYTIEETLRPFEMTMDYVKADYQPLFVFYGIDSNEGYSPEALQKVAQSAKDYIVFLEKM